MKRLIVALSLILLWVSVRAQNPAEEIQQESMEDNNGEGLKESPFSLSLELASRYIWRGLEYGEAPLGFATLSYSHKGFGAWVMGAYTFDNSHSEVDLGVTYTYKWITIGISDYFYPSSSGEKDKYFELDNHKTGHWGEAYVTLTPFSKYPFWFTGSCYFYGADKNPQGKQAYSSYAEIGYTYQFKENHNISLCIGAALNRGFYTSYEKDFSVVNIDLTYSTAFRFGRFKLPVSGSYILNPAIEKSYFKFSVYFNV